MRTELKRLFKHERLGRQDAKEILIRLLTSDVDSSLIVSFMTVYNMRTPDLAEMQGFVEAMIELCEPLSLDAAEAIDIVGTCGDGKNTFNISTLSSLVVAAAGIQVVKHGSYGSSSVCGSSNVLEMLGYRFSSDEAVLQRQLNEANICFLHAPLFHPVMAKVRQIRKDLGLQTFFNLLGPLINPASPGHLMLGVSQHSQIRMYEYLLQEAKGKYMIVHSMDGYDEISLTGNFKTVQRINTRLYSPEEVGLKRILHDDIKAGETIEEAAAMFLKILKGEGTDQQNAVVAANSAFGIQCVRPELDLSICLDMAAESLQSGKAYQTFKRIIELS